MAKLAKKVPLAIKTVVSIAKDQAEVWYAAPSCLGTIDYQNGYWYTKDGMRFVSGRDAMEYLIKLVEVSRPHYLPTKALPVPTIKPEAPAPAKPVPTVKDSFVNEILVYLSNHPEVKQLLQQEKKQKEKDFSRANREDQQTRGKRADL